MNTSAQEVDPFFEPIANSLWNACVGPQGSELNYVDGFIEAAIELADTLVNQKKVSSLDTLIMPILYNGRHGLELALKYTIKELGRVGAMNAPKTLFGHDVLKLLTTLVNANIGDRTIRAVTSNLRKYATSFNKIDKDGQELRFPTNTKGTQSLQDVYVINLPHVRESLQVLRELLSTLQNRVQSLAEERRTGTFTSRCSRHDLIQIARVLARTDDENSRNTIIYEFEITSQELDEAIQTIQNSRQLAGMIGTEAASAALDDEKAVSTLRKWVAWRNAETPQIPRVISMAAIDLEAVVKRHHALSAIFSELNEREYADFEALYYMGRNDEPGEDYLVTFDEALQRNKDNDARAIIDRINLLECVRKGSRIVGRISLAKSLDTLTESVK